MSPSTKSRTELDREFKERLSAEGFSPELIGLGLRLADNYSRSREEALKLGEKYIREMSK